MSLLAQSIVYGQSPRFNTAALSSLVFQPTAEGVLVGSALPTDGVTHLRDTPTQPLSRLKQGNSTGSFSDIWYNRVHVNPNPIALGSLTSNQIVSVEVWAAYFIPTNLLSISASNADGLTFDTSPKPPPAVFAALESVDYNLSISTDGPPVINAAYEFAFDVGTEILTVTGSRLTILQFPYENPATMESSFLTEVQMGVEGETRIALRSVPRAVIKPKYKLERSDFTALAGMLYDANDRQFGIPLWMDAGVYFGDILSGATSLLFDAEWLRFKAGGLALIWEDRVNFEALEISSVSATGLVFNTPIQNNYSARAFIVPMRNGLLAGRPKLGKLNNDFSSSEVSFNIVENYVEDDPVLTQYNGKDLVIDRNYTYSSINDSNFKNRIMIDEKTGILSLFALRNKTKEYMAQNWLAKGKQARYELIQLIESRKGKQKDFYFPTWRNDIKVLATIGAAAVNITIEENAYGGYQDAGGKAVYIELTDGTVFLRLADLSETGAVTIDSNLGQQVEPGEIHLFSFLQLVRLDTDRLKYTFDQDTLKISTPMVTTL